MRNIIAVVALVLTPPFCQAQSPEEQKVLDSFKSLVRHHVDSYKQNGRVHITKLSGGWAKERFTLEPASTKFDVERTSSLVSPFAGTLTFTLTRSLSDFHETEADAAADTIFIRDEVAVHKHVFAYQDREWQPTDRRYKIIGSVLKGDFPCDELLVKGRTLAEKDIHGCLEEFDDK